MSLFRKEKPASVPASAEVTGKSWFARLKSGLARSSNQIGDGVASIFTGGRRRLDAAAIEEIEELLIAADMGPATAAKLADGLAKLRFEDEV